MKNSHNNQILESVRTDFSIAGSANSPAGDIPMPDPFEVAMLLGNKDNRLDEQLWQGLMNEILDNAPQRPSTRLRLRSANNM